jgi:hypothetical protein
MNSRPRFSSVLVCLLWLMAPHAALEAQGSAIEPTILSQFTANKGARKLKVVTETNTFSTSSTAFVNIPGSSTTIAVPAAWSGGRIVARFSGESACGGTDGWCAVRILVNGVELTPVVGTQFAFDDTGSTTWESSFVERTSGTVNPGSYAVTVEAAVVGSATFFNIDDWTLTVVLWRVS